MKVSNLTTGTVIGIKFTYNNGDGTDKDRRSANFGSWRVPHDTEYGKIEDMGQSIGSMILTEIAKQPLGCVVSVEIIDWHTRHGNGPEAEETTGEVTTDPPTDGMSVEPMDLPLYEP